RSPTIVDCEQKGFIMIQHGPDDRHSVTSNTTEHFRICKCGKNTGLISQELCHGAFTYTQTQPDLDAPAAPPAAAATALLDTDAAPSSDVITTLLLDCDDETFSANLVTYIATDHLGRHTAILQDSRVMSRLCALPDSLFTETLLTLAHADHAGLDVLY